MQDLTVTIIQSDLAWRNPEKNIQHFDDLINNSDQATDLIVLPEMFTTGFTMEPQALAEKPREKTLKWMFCKAVEKKCAILGSYIVEDKGEYFNRLYMVMPNGRTYFYDKRHLFRMANENKFFSPGIKQTTVKIKAWKISLMICYDLRFPVWCRNTYNNGAYGFDCQIFVANWPEVRSYTWKTLLCARAIENQAYVAGVNRIGTDGNGISHSGDSMVVNPWGEIISKTQAHEESVETVVLSASRLESFRNSVTFGLDWDGFTLD
jgi:omega-amidase